MSVWYQLFHRMIPGVRQHKTKNAFINEVTALPINSVVEGSFRAMFTAQGQSYYFRLAYDRMYEDCVLQRLQYIHELFLSRTRVKLFFDLDMPGVSMTDDEKTSFLLRFYNFYIQHFTIGGFHVAPEEFLVLESLHTKAGDVKTLFRSRSTMNVTLQPLLIDEGSP
jgi:hypothetical protein